MSKAKKYSIYIKKSAEREMDRLSKVVFDRVAAAILALEASPRPRSSKKLRGSESYRIRVGNYRILYIVEDSSGRIDVVAVGHRRDVYRGI